MISLRDSLTLYRDCWAKSPLPGHEHQQAVVERFQTLIQDGPACLERTHLPGHITGSIMVATPDLSRILLTLHRKLGMWLQLGGHADGEAKLYEVALREGEEESGLRDLRFASVGAAMGSSSSFPLPYDLDVHRIPARATEPEHYHYDARYLAITHNPESIQISEESADLKWFTVKEAYGLTNEPAMLRQFEKLTWLKTQYPKTTW